MTEFDGQFPGYGFSQHKGYGTEEHREAVLRLGRCVQHRELFLRKLLAARVDPGQIDFLAEEADSAHAPLPTVPNPFS
jgi:ribonuclease HII